MMLKTLVLLLLVLAGSYSWACPIINGTFKSTTSGLSLNVSSSVDKNQIVTYDISSAILGKSTYIADRVTRVPLGIREYTSYVTVSCPDDDLLIGTDIRMTADKSSFWHFIERYHLDSDGFSYQVVSDMRNDDGTFTHSDKTTPYLKVSK